MTRRLITAVLRFVLRVFFRRIEVAGLENVPRDGGAMFVVNHPNGLVDPLFILCLAPRPVVFLAKSPLFKMPLVGFFVRVMESIPIYRRQDEGADTSRNRETFERCRALLKRGGTIAICPEGVSHNEPSLRPLKSGAARIALGAASSGTALDVKIVPAGLYYTAKTAFRSSALLYFGEPVAVKAVELDQQGNPSREAVQELSDRIAEAMRETTLNAEHHEALTVAARAERIFSSAEDEAEAGQSLVRELKLRRLFVEGYAFHHARSPERLAALEARIRLYEQELEEAGLDPQHLSSAVLSEHARARHLLTRILLFSSLLPPALAGAVLHYPAYRLAGFFATKFSHNYDDVVSTIKMIAAALLFPLTWLVVATLFTIAFDWRAGALALLLAPLTGWAALRFFEKFDRFVAGTKAVAFFVTRRRFFKQLLAERRAIRNEILALGEEATRSDALKTAVEG